MAEPRYRFMVISDDQYHHRAIEAAVFNAGQSLPIHLSLCHLNSKLDAMEPADCIFISYNEARGGAETGAALEKVGQRYEHEARRPLVIVLVRIDDSLGAVMRLRKLSSKPHAYVSPVYADQVVACIVEHTLSRTNLINRIEHGTK